MLSKNWCPPRGLSACAPCAPAQGGRQELHQKLESGRLSRCDRCDKVSNSSSWFRLQIWEANESNWNHQSHAQKQGTACFLSYWRMLENVGDLDAHGCWDFVASWPSHAFTALLRLNQLIEIVNPIETFRSSVCPLNGFEAPSISSISFYRIHL